MRIITLIFLLLCASVVWAFEITQTGVNLHVTYTEPSTTVNGTPLDDLATTDTVVKDSSGAILLTHQEPATALTGGGVIAFDLVIDVPLGQKQILTAEVTASDLVGNMSLPVISTVVIDREAPGTVE